MKPAPTTDGALPVLDGLRGAAALLVFVFHFLCSVPYFDLTVPPAVLRISTYLAVLSVDVFFAASGYILFRSLERVHGQAGATAGRATLDFYIRRCSRIVPLWWLVLTIELFRQGLALDVFLANASFLYGFLCFDARYLPILVAWTLFVEMTFYALLPVIFPRVRGIPSAAVFLVLMVALARVWVGLADSLGIPSDNHFIDDFPLRCFKYFAVGILVRFLHPRVPQKWSPWLDAAAVAGVAVTCATLRFVTPTILLLLLAILVPGSRLARGIGVRPLAFVGVHCYFVYLTHNQLFIDPMLNLFLGASSPLPRFGSPWAGPAWLALVLAVVLCLAAARVSMKMFEGPCVTLGKRIGTRVLAGSRVRGNSGEADRAA